MDSNVIYDFLRFNYNCGAIELTTSPPDLIPISLHRFVCVYCTEPARTATPTDIRLQLQRLYLLRMLLIILYKDNTKVRVILS